MAIQLMLTAIPAIILPELKDNLKNGHFPSPIEYQKGPESS